MSLKTPEDVGAQAAGVPSPRARPLQRLWREPWFSLCGAPHEHGTNTQGPCGTDCGCSLPPSPRGAHGALPAQPGPFLLKETPEEFTVCFLILKKIISAFNESDTKLSKSSKTLKTHLPHRSESQHFWPVWGRASLVSPEGCQE